MAAARPGARAGDRRAHPRGVPRCGPLQELARAASAPIASSQLLVREGEELVCPAARRVLDRVLDVAGERADQPGAPQAVAAGPRLLAPGHDRRPLRRSERLGDVLGRDPLLPAEVGDRPRQPQAPVPAAGAEAESAMPRVQGQPRLLIELAVLGAARRASSRRWRDPGPRRFSWAPACPDDPLPDRGRALRLFGRKLLRPAGGSTVSVMSIRSASAPLSFAMYRETAPGWQSHSPESGPFPQGHGFDAATSMKRQGSDTVPVVLVDGDDALLERHPQRLEGVAAELAELVEEEDAAMRASHLSRAGRRPAADQRPPGDGVVRRPERPLEPRASVLPAGARDPGHLDHLVRASEAAAATGSRCSASVLPPPGRPDQQQAVRARRGDLEAAARAPDGRAGRRGRADRGSGGVGGSAGGTGSISPSASSRSRVTCSTGITSSPSTSAAWLGVARRYRDAPHAPARSAASAIARAPGTGRIAPSSASSPASDVVDRARHAAAGRTRPAARRRSPGRSPARPCGGRPARGWR